MIMRFRLDWGSAANRFRLLLSKYTVLVQEIIAARYNNYCNALTNLGFPFILTDQCTFLCECSLLQGLMHMPDAIIYCSALQ